MGSLAHLLKIDAEMVRGNRFVVAPRRIHRRISVVWWFRSGSRAPAVTPSPMRGVFGKESDRAVTQPLHPLKALDVDGVATDCRMRG